MKQLPFAPLSLCLPCVSGSCPNQNPVLLAVLSWLLSLLATASVPITKSIFMLKIATTDGSFTLATAGAFGLCYPGGNHQ